MIYLGRTYGLLTECGLEAGQKYKKICIIL